MRKHLEEVERALKPHGNKKRKEMDEWYLKSKLENLGITVPEQRAIHKKGFSFSSRDETVVDRIWNDVWKNAKSHEAASQALLHFSDQKHVLAKSDWTILKTWATRVDNWAHSDYLSELYSRLHEAYPKLVYPTLQKWNASKNTWLRRMSIVSLIYYASPKRKAPPLSKVFPLVKNLLHDEDPYVRKGVGWTLRECYNIDPKKTYTFLRKHIHDLSAISFSYATEKVTKKEKEELKRLRRG